MGTEAALSPNPWMILPFGVLLATIALAPLFAPTWWSRHYPKVALALGAVTLVYYLGVLPSSELVGHPAHATFLDSFRDWVKAAACERVWHTTHEYLAFICLIGALFVVAGGIHISVKGEARPIVNVVFLFIGAVVANVLGTTGAAMLLIRPWLRLNKYRVTGHHVVFFIFIVANVGGCLTPIGDPPLFLGYLKGIPFWWVAEHCWPMWLTGVGALLLIFYVLDRRNFRRAPQEVRHRMADPHDVWRFEGLSNLFFLAVILGAVFINRPLFLREALMVGAALGSYFTTRKTVHQANHFTFHPIQEVAILFIGIFATMMPALDWLQLHAGNLGQPTPGLFYWGTGTLSSVLDNAPTYLSFLSAAFGTFVNQDVVVHVHQLLQTHGAGAALTALSGAHADAIRATVGALQKYHSNLLARGTVTKDEIEVAYLLGNVAYNKFILAISVGAVFFGANTYIGNGPNFMVKSIADHAKVHTPSFLGYVFKYTLPYLVPVLVLVWWVFFFHH